MPVKPIAAGPGAGTEGLEENTRPMWSGLDQERMYALNPHAEPGRSHEDAVKSDSAIDARRKALLSGLNHILLFLPMVEDQRAVIVAAMKFITDAAALK